jgi:hypothetical protein
VGAGAGAGAGAGDLLWYYGITHRLHCHDYMKKKVNAVRSPNHEARARMPAVSHIALPPLRESTSSSSSSSSSFSSSSSLRKSCGSSVNTV